MPRKEPELNLFQPTNFGRGRVVGDDPRLLDLYMNPKTREKFLRIAAWEHACPIPDEVYKEFGVDWTIERYLECNFVWGYILDVAEQLNPELYQQLSDPVLRKFDEPMGKHEQGRIPKSHKTFMSPLSTLYGYALPRVFLEIAGRGKHRTQERYLYAMEQLESAVKVSHKPTELLARLTNAAQSNEMTRVRAVKLLDHVLPAGIVKEENNVSQCREVVEMLETYAPAVFRTYKRLSPKKRKKLSLASIPLEHGHENNI